MCAWELVLLAPHRSSEVCCQGTPLNTYKGQDGARVPKAFEVFRPYLAILLLIVRLVLSCNKRREKRFARTLDTATEQRNSMTASRIIRISSFRRITIPPTSIFRFLAGIDTKNAVFAVFPKLLLNRIRKWPQPPKSSLYDLSNVVGSILLLKRTESVTYIISTAATSLPRRDHTHRVLYPDWSE